MSTLAAAKFLNSIASNPDRFSRVREAINGRSPDELGAALSDVGAAFGFVFTGADAVAVSQVLLVTEGDIVLSGVRGGTGSVPSQTMPEADLASNLSPQDAQKLNEQIAAWQEAVGAQQQVMTDIYDALKGVMGSKD